MNILQASDLSISRVIGGGERFLYEQGQRLAERGHRVVNLTRLLPEHDDVRQRVGAVEEYRYRVAPGNPAAFLASTLKNGRRLFESLHRKHRFDCIHFHQPFSAFAVNRSPSARRIRRMYVCHSLSFEEYISRNTKPAGIHKTLYLLNILVRRKMERQVLRQSDDICVLSAYTKEKLVRTHAIPSRRIHVIPGGVDLKRFSPAAEKKEIRRRLGFPEDRLIFLTVRNLVPRMGLEALIEAFSEVLQTIPEAYLVIGGSGPMMTRLKETAGRLGVAEQVFFTGFIDEAQLPDVYRQAELFVLPTRELEGFGLVTVEALASGVPVLGTPVGGTREILEKFDSAFLFQDTSPASMARGIVDTRRIICEEPERWEKIRKRCRAFAEDYYSWERNVDAMERLMHQGA